MSATRTATCRRGVLILEIAAALALLGLLMGIAGSAMLRYARAREYDVWRQAAAWAAEAQLRRFQAGAALDSSPPPGMVADRITLETVADPAENDWVGFNRVKVTATVVRERGKPIRQSVSGYVPERGTP